MAAINGRGERVHARTSLFPRSVAGLERGEVERRRPRSLAILGSSFQEDTFFRSEIMDVDTDTEVVICVAEIAPS